MINFCQFGAGRIGAIHAGNIARHSDARLQIVVDPDRAAAERLAARYGAKIGSQAEALADAAVDAVVIASSTDTHADLIEAAARAGKAVFCEKPLDLDRRRAEACVAVARECGVPMMVAFNRRFDPHFAKLEREIRAGRIGRAELVTIKSYDPAPPSIAFVRRSGGLFRDMVIHDLDMACWLLAEEPVEIFARGSVLVDPAIGEAGDFDTAVASLRMPSGALCQIAGTRRAVYGYDQRIEVLGERGPWGRYPQHDPPQQPQRLKCGNGVKGRRNSAGPTAKHSLVTLSIFSIRSTLSANAGAASIASRGFRCPSVPTRCLKCGNRGQPTDLGYSCSD